MGELRYTSWIVADPPETERAIDFVRTPVRHRIGTAGPLPVRRTPEGDRRCRPTPDIRPHAARSRSEPSRSPCPAVATASPTSRHRPAIRYVGKCRHLDSIEDLPQLQHTLAGEGLPRTGEIATRRGSARASPRPGGRPLSASLLRTRVQPVGSGVLIEHLRHAAVDIVGGFDEALQCRSWAGGSGGRSG